MYDVTVHFRKFSFKLKRVVTFKVVNMTRVDGCLNLLFADGSRYSYPLDTINRIKRVESKS